MTIGEGRAGVTLGDGVFALAHERPTSAGELCTLVEQFARLRTPIYPQGGCTSLNYGGTPARPGVAVDTTGLAGVVDYPFADMTITVEAGITLEGLRRVLLEHNQRVALDPPDAGRATIGGIFATNETGPRRYSAGRPRDVIIGAQFVTAEGRLAKGGGRVVKNVAGYDLPKLMTGALGTLGILSQVTLKVRPIPETASIVWGAYRRLEGVMEALDRLNLSATRPAAIELLNAGALRWAQDRGAVVPEAPWGLAVAFEGNAGAVDWQTRAVRPELGDCSILVCESGQTGRTWDALVELEAAEHRLSLRASLPPSAQHRYLTSLMDDSCLIRAHAGSGEVFASFLGLEDTPLNGSVLERIAALQRLARELGGNAVVVHCPASWKPAVRVWGEARTDLWLMHKIKAALDPHNLLNPGRFV